jgi:hypothetical protein
MYLLNNTPEKNRVHTQKINPARKDGIYRTKKEPKEKGKGKRLEDKTLSSNAPNGI